LPIVLKLLLMSATAVGVSLVVRKRHPDRVSPFASLIATFGLVIMCL
jgi:hypothetical protein